MKKIFGFDLIENQLFENLKNNRLHHCNMINGPKGIGKSSFIYNFATKILAQKYGDFINNVDVFENNYKLIENNSHPDLLVLDINSLDEDNKENTSKKGEINVSQTRNIISKINFTNSLSKNKVFIIDAIDELNKEAQNVLLKTLEEPPENTYIFLICHNYNNVLDTIKSRSNVYNINKLDFGSWKNIIFSIEDINISDENDFLELYNLSNSSIGLTQKILSFDYKDFYKQLVNCIVNKNIIEIQNFCTLTDKNFDMFCIFMDNFFNNLKNCYINLEENNEIYSKIMEKHNLESFFNNYEYYLKMIKDINSYNLSKIHCVNVLLLKLFENK